MKEYIEDMGFDASFNHPTTFKGFQTNASQQMKPKGNKRINNKGTISPNQNRLCIIQVLGMTCQSCVKNIETNLPLRLNYVTLVKVSLENKTATIVYNTANPNSNAENITDKDSLGYPIYLSCFS